jgi:hypothetical protein
MQKPLDYIIHENIPLAKVKKIRLKLRSQAYYRIF